VGITITEALAEIKTTGKRIEKKRNFMFNYLVRQEGVKDPLERDGGSAKVIEQERQGIRDLETRLIALRRGIQRANDETEVTINGQTRSISEWLTWRRDIAPGQKVLLSGLQAGVNNIRQQAKQQGASIISATAITADVKPTDLVINVDERKIGEEIEALEDTLGQLDGQLSLKNATVTIKE
jgi:hypothetical protein